MGIHPKIGITGLPRSGKSAVMEKVLSMLKEERTRELAARNSGTETEIIGGICTEPILDGKLFARLIHLLQGGFDVVSQHLLSQLIVTQISARQTVLRITIIELAM
mgnify:CR=1 FL=1